MALEQITDNTENLKQQLINHPLYNRMQHPEDLRVFMQHHVFAVWDFMSLLKALQQKLTCVQTPWVPIGDGNTRFLINEIVVGEESDVDEEGNRMSHFELYLKAMKEAQVPAKSIESLLELISEGLPIQAALQQLNVSDSIKQFVKTTFDVIATGKPHVMAAVFTFGREDLIPGMFMSMVRELNTKHDGRFSTFQYYLERHIEVDGDHHSHLALDMTRRLCDDNPVKITEAELWVKRSLQARKALWDGVLEALPERAHNRS